MVKSFGKKESAFPCEDSCWTFFVARLSFRGSNSLVYAGGPEESAA